MTTKDEIINHFTETYFDDELKIPNYKIDRLNSFIPPMGKERLDYYYQHDRLFKSEIDNDKDLKDLDAGEGEVIESFSPMTNIPSANEILKQFKELNPDGTRKKLAHEERDMAEDTRRQIVMNKRAQAINNGQPYYKASVQTTFGEGVGIRGKKFYYIHLELKKFDNFADVVKLVSDEEVQRNKKICKGR